MEFDAVTIVVFVIIVAVLLWALATGRRDARASRAGQRLSGWHGSAMWLGIFGATAVSSTPYGDDRGGAGHGMDGDWSGGNGGGDQGGGGGGWGGGDFGGGGDGGGGGGGN